MYLDSAIIVKLLVREDDSAWFDRSLSGHELWTSELALAEVRSAILMKERSGQISAGASRRALARFKALEQENWLHFYPLDRSVVEHAAGLLQGAHPDVALRSLDAIHLATAVRLLPQPLCTTDGRLRAAAGRIGVACHPEDLSEIVKD